MSYKLIKRFINHFNHIFWLLLSFLLPHHLVAKIHYEYAPIQGNIYIQFNALKNEFITNTPFVLQSTNQIKEGKAQRLLPLAIDHYFDKPYRFSFINKDQISKQEITAIFTHSVTHQQKELPLEITTAYTLANALNIEHYALTDTSSIITDPKHPDVATYLHAENTFQISPLSLNNMTSGQWHAAIQWSKPPQEFQITDLTDQTITYSESGNHVYQYNILLEINNAFRFIHNDLRADFKKVQNADYQYLAQSTLQIESTIDQLMLRIKECSQEIYFGSSHCALTKKDDSSIAIPYEIMINHNNMAQKLSTETAVTLDNITPQAITDILIETAITHQQFIPAGEYNGYVDLQLATRF